MLVDFKSRIGHQRGGRSFQRSRPSQQLVFYSRVLLGILQFYRVSWSGQIYFLGVDKKEEEEGKNDP